MKLQKINLKNFRRFTDLTVQNIPESVQLIMLVGPNGCGKSGFFDSLEYWMRRRHGKKSFSSDSEYYDKVSTASSVHPSTTSEILTEVMFHRQPNKDEIKKSIYVRSAYRNDPDFRLQTLNRTNPKVDENRFQKLIENDAAVKNNYQRMVGNAMEDIFENESDEASIGKFRERVIGEVRDSFKFLFDDVILNSLGNPLTDGTFRFTKGVSKGFAFKNLSGGEKAAFDLILDLIVARREFNDTLFCIDEPESHMNAKLQAKLLSVLYDLIPENCQLMLATHSIGMMRKARDIENDKPGSVAFLDFGDRDFDVPQVIEPSVLNRNFWENAYAVALDDLATLVAPERIVICEGQPNVGNSVTNHNHDARCYDAIFADEFSETRFVSLGNCYEVSNDRFGFADLLRMLFGELEIVRLIDRDDRSDQEISDLADKGVHVLSRRNLESYIFDDEVLEALAKSNNQEEKIQELLECKQRILNNKPDDMSSDDLKPQCGEIYNACKSILDLSQVGNNTKAFMRDTLAPLIKPNMNVYHKLKRDVFGIMDN